MKWRDILPANKYIYVGLILVILGLFTIGYIIGLFILPVGLLAFAFGLRKNYDTVGKKIINRWQKIKKSLRKP